MVNVKRFVKCPTNRNKRKETEFQLAVIRTILPVFQIMLVLIQIILAVVTISMVWR